MKLVLTLMCNSTLESLHSHLSLPSSVSFRCCSKISVPLPFDKSDSRRNFKELMILVIYNLI